MSTIEEKLSLSLNGGVYFEGARVDPQSDGVLIIGLGGTGADFLLAAKEQIMTRFKLPKDDSGKVISAYPEGIEFVEIDTDMSTMKHRSGVAGFEKNGSDICLITVPGLKDVIDDIKNNHISEPCWKWLDRSISADGGSDGAGCIRQVGRIMFMKNILNIKEKINSAINRISKKTSKIKVIICSGIAGGTGSGCFLDAAYVVQQCLKNNSISEAQVLGYIATPDVNAINVPSHIKTMLFSNGYACLKELDFWMATEQHDKTFNQIYPDGFEVNIKAKPFDFCHLVSSQAGDGTTRTYNQVVRAVADNIFSYLAGEVTNGLAQTTIKSLYDNINAGVIAANPVLPACHRYISIGSSTLEIPYTEITTLLAARVFQKLAPAFKNAPTQDSFKEDLYMLELTDKHIMTFFEKDVRAYPLANAKFSYSDVWEGQNRPYVMSETWGADAQLSVRRQKSNFASYCESKYKEYFESIMKNPQKGPCYVAKLIYSPSAYSLIKTLEGFKKQCSDLCSQCSVQAGNLKRQLDEAYSAGIGVSAINFIKRGNVLENYINVLSAYENANYKAYLYDDLSAGIGELIKRLQKWYDDLFLPLSTLLCELPGIFEKNVEYIEQKELDMRKSDYIGSNWIIYPTQFEKAHRAELENEVNVAVNTFWDSLVKNLGNWIGADFETFISGNGNPNFDAAMEISKFMESCFKNSLKLSMEKIFDYQRDPNVSLESYAEGKIKEISGKAVPLYKIKDGSASVIKIPECGFLSIPHDASKIIAGAEAANVLGDGGKIKKSNEVTRITYTKFKYVLPLYLFSYIYQMETEFEKAGANTAYIDVNVGPRIPSPIQEKAWFGGYSNEKAHKRNEECRKEFDYCINKGIIRVEEHDGAKELYLFRVNKDYSLPVLSEDVSVAKRQLAGAKATLWGNVETAIILNDGSNNKGGIDIEKIRENTIRFFNLMDEIHEQRILCERFEEFEKDYSMPKIFVDAYISELIILNANCIYFKKSVNDAFPQKLYDLGNGKEFWQYNAYLTLRNLAQQDSNLSENVSMAKSRIYDGGARQEKAFASLEKLKDKFTESSVLAGQRITEFSEESIREHIKSTKRFYDVALSYIEECLTPEDIDLL